MTYYMSPARLPPSIQEELRSQFEVPNLWWAQVCATILLKRTKGATVRRVLPKLFEKYDEPRKLANANIEELRETIRSCGFKSTKPSSLVFFSSRWVQASVVDQAPSLEWLAETPGVGPYILDSYRIFAIGDLESEPSDSALKRAIMREKVRLGLDPRQRGAIMLCNSSILTPLGKEKRDE